MKNKILTLVVIGFMACTVLICAKNTGVENNKDAKESIGKTIPDSQAVQTSLSDDWQKFKNDSQQKIQDNENSITAFKEKMEKSGKADYNKEIAKLEKTNREMKKKLEEYKNDGKSAWEDFKTGFNNDMDKLGKAVKDLTSDNN
jgi:Skp family chaperone for outer membrane proteins